MELTCLSPGVKKLSFRGKSVKSYVKRSAVRKWKCVKPREICIDPRRRRPRDSIPSVEDITMTPQEETKSSQEDSIMSPPPQKTVIPEEDIVLDEEPIMSQEENIMEEEEFVMPEDNIMLKEQFGISHGESIVPEYESTWNEDKPSPLLELSNELLGCILVEVDPSDLAALSSTCNTLRYHIRGNRLLHKNLYTRRYDEPSTTDNIDWEEEIHRTTKLEKILQSSNRDLKREQLDFVQQQVQSMLETAHPDFEDSANMELLTQYFNDTENIDTLLCSSSLFERGGTSMQRAAPTSQLRQASAKLHCLYGKPIEPVATRKHSAHYAISPFLQLRQLEVQSPPSENTRLQTRGTPAHMVARSRVYDLRQYTDATLWGPFTNDGTQTVDWEKVEAVMLVLGFNLRKFSDRSGGRFPRLWDTPWEGATPSSYFSASPIEGPTKALDWEISRARELAPAIDTLDPYGVTGTWMRIVCFLDYNDLYAFNFSARVSEHEDRQPIDTEEAIRLIRIKLQVTRIEAPGAGDEDEEEDGMDWSNFEGERLPIVHFRGSSRSLHASWDPNANSRIRGTVRQTPEGEIRWTTFSIFHGEERWRSEGIQVGGLRSARGVLGNWFDKDYDMHGPAGPTAFWKETDEVVEEKTSSTPLAYF